MRWWLPCFTSRSTYFVGRFGGSYQKEYDVYDPRGEITMAFPLLQRRSKTIEIVAEYDLVIALDESGLCAAFSRETGERVYYLNGHPYEVIRSLFYNKNNDSIITVSVYGAENYGILRCRSTRIEYIRRDRPDDGFPLFQAETLKWPGFVEFDDVTGKILTFSAEDIVYKVFDLKNHTMLYSITDKNVEEIKIRLVEEYQVRWANENSKLREERAVVRQSLDEERHRSTAIQEKMQSEITCLRLVH